MSKSNAAFFVATLLSSTLALGLPAGASEPWSPDAINLAAPVPQPALNSSAVTTEVSLAHKGPSYQDAGLENSLDNGDYASAQSQVNARLNGSSRGALVEAYLRTALVESLTWQGQLPAADRECKKLFKLLDGLDGGKDYSADDVKELTARALDAQGWLLEAQGKLDDAQASLARAIALLRDLHSADRQTWRLVGCLSHVAGLKAEAGDYPTAKKMLEDALSQVNGSHSISALNVADVEENLGAVLFKMGDQAQATYHFNQALAFKNATNALVKRYAPGPYWLSPTYKYREGSPWSSKSYQNGVEKKLVNLGAVTVEAAVVRDKVSKQTLQALVSVTNNTNQPIQFEGRPPVLITLNPRATWALPIQPNDLAAKVEKKADGKAKWTRFWGEGATQTVTSTYMGNMPMYGYGYGGGFPMGYGYGNGFSTWNRGRNNNNYAFSTMNVPDPIAEARAFEKAHQIEQAGKAKAADIRSNSLGPCDIAPGQNLAGTMYFDAAGGLGKGSGCLLRVPVGNALCEFSFDTIGDAP